MARLKPMLAELKKRRSRINKTIRAMQGLMRSEEDAETLLPPKKPMARARVARKKTSAAA
jgi:hypothetical protein